MAEVRILETSAELGVEAADFVTWVIQESLRTSGRCRLALSGGSTPRLLYEALVQASVTRQVEWSAVDWFFSDERCVPLENQASNYRLAQECLFTPLHIPFPRIFRMEGEQLDHEDAARRYEDTLRREFGLSPDHVPVFDLILLGLGDDGHTASLFSGTPALAEQGRLVVHNIAPQEPRERLTLTLPVLNHGKHVLFLISGRGKASVVKEILERETGSQPVYPAEFVKPIPGRLLWFLDRPAAAELTQSRQQVDTREE